MILQPAIAMENSTERSILVWCVPTVDYRRRRRPAVEYRRPRALPTTTLSEGQRLIFTSLELVARFAEDLRKSCKMLCGGGSLRRSTTTPPSMHAKSFSNVRYVRIAHSADTGD